MANWFSVGSAGVGALGSLLGGAISAGATGRSQQRQYEYQRLLQEHSAQLNYDFNQKSLKNSPSSTRQGLIKAGYNPMLAVQNATGGANASFASTGQAGTYNDADAINGAISSATQYASLINQDKQTESTVATNEAVADANYANADKAKAEKTALMEKMPFISQREKAEISNIEKDSLKKEAEIHNIDETTRFIDKRFELDKMLGEMGIQAQRYSADKAFNASTYASNVSRANNISTNRTTRGSFGLGPIRAFMGVRNKKANKWYDNL